MRSAVSGLTALKWRSALRGVQRREHRKSLIDMHLVESAENRFATLFRAVSISCNLMSLYT